MVDNWALGAILLMALSVNAVIVRLGFTQGVGGYGAAITDPHILVVEYAGLASITPSSALLPIHAPPVNMCCSGYTQHGFCGHHHSLPFMMPAILRARSTIRLLAVGRGLCREFVLSCPNKRLHQFECRINAPCTRG